MADRAVLLRLDAIEHRLAQLEGHEAKPVLAGDDVRFLTVALPVMVRRRRARSPASSASECRSSHHSSVKPCGRRVHSQSATDTASPRSCNLFQSSLHTPCPIRAIPNPGVTRRGRAGP